MVIKYYATSGGKNTIYEYIDSLSIKEKKAIYAILENLKEIGMKYLEILNTRQLKDNLWEIKYKQNRLMYVLVTKDNMYILHACKKQKDKAEKQELEKALRRQKELKEAIKNK